jgi:hypothetical protein
VENGDMADIRSFGIEGSLYPQGAVVSALPQNSARSATLKAQR